MMAGFMRYKYPFIRPKLPPSKEVAEDYERIVASNWFTNFGPFEKEFRQRVAEFVGEESYVTTIANATLALQAAIDTLIVPHPTRKQVIVPSFTFASGPEALIKAGLNPVFIDIELSDWQPSLAQASSYIKDNENTVAGILLGNTFGVGNNHITAWEDLARKHSIPLIVDSAAGFGSRYSVDEKLGLRGDCEIFSLHATKPFAVGEGGLVVSKNKDLIEKIRSYQNFGFNTQKEISTIGTNAKLQELNCAIGLRQLNGFEKRLDNRRASLKYYKNVLIPLGFTFVENSDLSTVCFASILAPDKKTLELVRAALDSAGIEARQYYSPLHKQPVLLEKSIVAGSLSNTEAIYSRTVSLPVYDSMAKEELLYTTETIQKALV